MKCTTMFMWILMLAVLASLPGCGLEGLAAAADKKKSGTTSSNPCGGAPGTCPNPGSTQCCTQWDAAAAHWRACVQYHNAGNASAAKSAASAYKNQLSRAKSICSSLRSVSRGPTLKGSAVGPTYHMRGQIDTIDADSVTAQSAQGFPGLAGGPQLGVDSSGRAYVVAAMLDESMALHQVLLAFTTGSSPAALLEPVLRAEASDELIRALLVVRDDTRDAHGNPVLVRDRLVLIVDGYDHAESRSWRELRLVDPEQPSAATVLYRRAPLPTRSPARVSGQLRATLGSDGTVYVVEEGDSAVASPGSMRAFAWSSDAGAYRERPEPVTTANTVTGSIAAGPDGYIYGFARVEAEAGAVADRVLRIDPTGTNTWSTFRAFEGGFARPSGTNADLVFDSYGELFLSAGTRTEGGALASVLLPVSGRDVVGGGRIAATTSTVLLSGMVAAGLDGALYVIERQLDAPPPAADLDVVIEIAPRR